MNPHRASLLAAGVTAALLLVSACGDGTAEPEPPPRDPSRPTTVSITPASAELTALGATVRLSAEVRDQYGQVMTGATVAWTSSDASVATVDATGLVTAVANGTATVTATAGSASGTVAVTVMQSVGSVVVSPTEGTMAVGDTLRLTAEAFDANGHEVDGAVFTWSSSDTSVVRVDESGLLQAVAKGTATVTATADSASGTAAVMVMQSVGSVVVSPAESTMAVGDTLRLTAEAFDENGHRVDDAAFTWSSSDTSVVRVDESGLVEAVANGTATVTATADSASGTAVVTVMQSVGSVVVSPPESTMAVGDTLRLTAEAFDENGHQVDDATFIWSSNDTSVVTVDEFGLVEAVTEGTAWITAAIGEVEGAAEITVTNLDRAALVALYEATDGPNWLNSDNWLTDAPLGEWYGVETDASGRVVGLDLAGEWDDEADQPIPHGLTGPIPPDLGNLTGLENLILPLNHLNGPIPAELGNLAALKELHLYDNELSGPIPPELGGLANLERLTLFDNRLSGPIPAELGNLRALEQLHLANNELSGPIPPELGNLTSLDQLELSFNQLTDTIPSELGRLVRLYELSLEANQLTGPIPPQLASITRLGLLFLRWNELSGPVPPGIVRMERLRWLALEGNASLCRPGTSVFATWLEGIELQDAERLSSCNETDKTTLGSLYLSTGGSGWTRSDGWPAGTLDQRYGVATDSVGRVTTLDLARNGLSGRLPPSLGLLDRMTQLRIGGNDLSGRLPSSLAGLPMRELHYADTELCTPTEERFQEWLKSIPSHEGTGNGCPPLSDREVLVALYDATGGPDWRLDLNWLTDAPLEEWIGVHVDHLGRVIELDLAFQQMVGPIPAELGSLANLKELNLCCNDGLSGPIPPELGNLTSLSHLYLFQNDLTGPIPPELGGLANLKELLLQSNSLTGPIPPDLGRLANLNELELSWNGLTGPIPPELGSLANLEVLVLALNSLTGPIPPGLGRLANLNVLELDWNGLSGPIPPELGGLANLERLGLNGNGLTGSIPAALGNLTALKQLYIASNELSGPIPSELSGLANLTRLVLWENRLGGPIPPDLGNLSALEQLFLEDNDLEGPIPPQLGNLSALEVLFLQGNGLEGPIPSEFGNLSALELLFLEDNDLSGPVPAEIGGMASLREVGLSGNSGLAGSLPAGMTTLSRLDALLAGGTDLCAPTDPGFQAWLEGVHKRRIAPCAGDPPMVYLTQAVQSRAFPVPLVAGEKALLRVFPTASRSGGGSLPDVRARFYRNGRETHVADLRGTSVPIPTEVDESSLDQSVNAEIPGRVIQPGLEMVIEVDPAGTLDPSLGVAKRIPETGRLPVDIRAMPVFDLTLVPFIWTETGDESIVSLVREIAASPDTHELLADTRTLLPIHDIEVTAHEPVLSSSNDSWDLLRKTTAVRAMEGGSGHYMGMMAPPRTGPAGIARLPGRSSFAGAGAFVIAHELGHNLSLYHAPCEGVQGTDPSFPYSDGSIGAWGYEFRDGGRLVRPSALDLMCYNGNNWISDYSFSNALRFRLSDADSVGLASPPMAAQPTKALLLWGGVHGDSVPFLEPAFVVEAPAVLPQARGDHRLAGLSADGRELFALGFDMPNVADGDGSSSFVFVLPIQPGWEGSLASITLSGPGGSATLDDSTDRPMSILRDPRTGRVRGFLSDLPPEARTAADAAGQGTGPGVEVLFSRGIPLSDAWRR